MRVASVAVLILSALACGSPSDESAPAMADSGISELQMTDVTQGSRAEAQKGRTVSVHYPGWLYSPAASDHKGSSFDSSKGRGPFEFNLGAGEVIPGWDQGVAGMKVGGKRVLTIPPAMGYGRQGAPPDIPPNATLLFEVELLNVR